MSEPRIVTPQEAQALANRMAASPQWFLREPYDITLATPALAQTVATEPDRIAAAERAAVVKALQEASRWVRASEDRDALADHIIAIENGADL